MVVIEKTKYYSKREICTRLGCCLATLNNKITAAGIDGYYFGRFKYYTEAQIAQLAATKTYNRYAKPAPAPAEAEAPQEP